MKKNHKNLGNLWKKYQTVCIPIDKESVFNVYLTYE